MCRLNTLLVGYHAEILDKIKVFRITSEVTAVFLSGLYLYEMRQTFNRNLQLHKSSLETQLLFHIFRCFKFVFVSTMLTLSSLVLINLSFFYILYFLSVILCPADTFYWICSSLINRLAWGQLSGYMHALMWANPCYGGIHKHSELRVGVCCKPFMYFWYVRAVWNV